MVYRPEVANINARTVDNFELILNSMTEHIFQYMHTAIKRDLKEMVSKHRKKKAKAYKEKAKKVKYKKYNKHELNTFFKKKS